MNKKVLITVNGECPYIPEMRQMLLDEGIESKQADLDRVDLEGLKEQMADCTSVIACAEPYNDAVFDSIPNLKCIVKSGVGLDSIDLDAATRHGVVVSNTPGANGEAVAEMAVTMMLSALRHTVYYNNKIVKGTWGSEFYSHELSTRTVGLIGFGFIARKVAQFLGGFGCRILACDIYPNYEAAKQLNVEIVDREEIFRQADIISLHAPLTPDTKELINKENISKMKDGVILINNSRGQLVVEEDLADALNSGKVYAAGLDVVSTEPIKADNPLLKAKNCIITPHISWAAQAARQRIMDITVENIRSFADGKPVNVVNM